MTTPARPRLLFINRSYWPDAEATGQLLTELCEDLARAFDVTVIAGQPNQNPDAAPYRQSGADWRRHVRIERVWHFGFQSGRSCSRAVNQVTFLATTLLRGMRCGARVSSSKPIHRSCPCQVASSLVASQSPRRLFARRIPRHIVLGKLRRGWLSVACAPHVHRMRGDHVVVLSEDMRDLLVCAVTPARIAAVPNWADGDRADNAQPLPSAPNVLCGDVFGAA